MYRYLLVSFMALVVIVTFAGSVNAQSSRDILNRLNRLENEVETMGHAIYRGKQQESAQSKNDGFFGGGQGMDDATRADTEVRLSQMESEIRSLRGQLEEYNYRLRQIENRLENGNRAGDQRGYNGYQNGYQGDYKDSDRQQDNSSRMAGGDDRRRSQRPLPDFVQTPPQFQSGVNDRTGDRQRGVLGTLRRPYDGGDSAYEEGENRQEGADFLAEKDKRNRAVPAVVRTLPEDTSPTEAYQQAFAMLRDKEYEPAENAFKSFIKTFPDHSLTPNAKYWLGETYYVRDDYERAARTFAEAYQQAPEGAKAADNLLKLGMALGGMGNTEDACLTLLQLKRQFSDIATPVLNRADREMRHLGCDRES